MRRRPRSRLLAALGAAAALLVPAALHAQSGETALTIHGPDGRIEAGGEPAPFRLDVRDITNLGGFEFVLTFDSDLLEFDRLEQGGFLGSTGREVICDDPQTDAGAVRLLCVTLQPEPAGASGAGTLATIWLRPRGEGEGEVKLSRYRLMSVSATELSARAEAATVRIGADGGIPRMIWGAIAGGAALLVVAVGALAAGRVRGRRTDGA